MNGPRPTGRMNPVGLALAGVLVLLLTVPLVALALSASPADLRAGLASPLFGSASFASITAATARERGPSGSSASR